MEWQPIEQQFIKSSQLRDSIHENGYVVHGNIGVERVGELYTLYRKLHQLNAPNGGNFYSLYSEDLAYRKKVHSEIWRILQPVYEKYFENFKSVINSFIIKAPGPNSEFSLHQDSTGLNELNYSSLSIWIPLQDTNMSNGTLCFVPKSHRFFYPYRGISFATPFYDFEDTLRSYLVPLDLKAGDIVMFDNRTVHYSHLNTSASDRVVVMSGIFPVLATMEICYRDESIPNSSIEIYAMEEDFLLTNTNFYNDCTARPVCGKVVRKVPMPEKKSVYEFMSFAAANNIAQTNIDELVHVRHTMSIVSEPV